MFLRACDVLASIQVMKVIMREIITYDKGMEKV